MCAFSTSDAQQDKHADVSLLTRSFVLSKLYSATAHHEHEAQRNANCIAQSLENFIGDEGIRTPDPLLARQVLSQLSYTPKNKLGLRRLELPTSRLSGVRSNRLSYKPIRFKSSKPSGLYLISYFNNRIMTTTLTLLP